jgi:hypothetical protein
MVVMGFCFLMVRSSQAMMEVLEITRSSRVMTEWGLGDGGGLVFSDGGDLVSHLCLLFVILAQAGISFQLSSSCLKV